MSTSILPSLSHSMMDESDDVDLSALQLEPEVSPGNTPTRQASSTSPNGGFATDLTKIQEEQVLFLNRIEREKQRKIILEQHIEDAKHNLRLMQDKTKNGNIVKDHDVMNKKLFSRMEYQLQTSKVKLSTARNDNINLKRRVEDLRREKLLHLQILADLAKEVTKSRRRSKYCQKEITIMNEKKHRVKVSIAGTKQKMIRDMEEFSVEIGRTKDAITNTQAVIMNTIREKLDQTTSNVWVPPPMDSTFVRLSSARETTEFASRHGGREQTAPTQTVKQSGHTASELESILKDTEFKNAEDLLIALQQSEETIFALYNETQSRHEEVEKMELENKHLEVQVQEQMKTLHQLEGQQEQVKQEVEKNILSLKSAIAKYDERYSGNFEILSGISENLMSLLKNVAADEEAVDQQLLSTGVNDRNIHEYLGLVEQRIDDLIQMSKAATHQAIKSDDFLKMSTHKVSSFQLPTPPSLLDNDDDDEMDNNVNNNTGEPTRLQPLNVSVLKEIIQKKAQKMTVAAPPPRKVEKLSLPTESRSRQHSTASLKSSESGLVISEF